jgi:hypothetical protein
MRSNNKLVADLPILMVPATLLCKPRNTSQGGGAHFWAGAIPIAARSDCLNNMRKRLYWSVIWFRALIPHIRTHLTTHRQTLVLNSHLAKYLSVKRLGREKEAHLVQNRIATN